MFEAALYIIDEKISTLNYGWMKDLLAFSENRNARL